jgi:hypothetical protein
MATKSGRMIGSRGTTSMLLVPPEVRVTSDRPALLQALKQSLAPALRERGFLGSRQHFRRIRHRTLELVAIRIDRQEGGFYLELACCDLYHLTDAAGDQEWPGHVTAWAVVMAALGPHTRLLNPACALQGSEFPGWHRTPEGAVAREASVARGVQDALAALPELDRWFARAMSHGRH